MNRLAKPTQQMADVRLFALFQPLGSYSRRMFDYELTSRASMESDTQRIALGLRQADVVVLETLVKQFQYRLVRYLVSLLGRREGVDDLVQETWLRVLERGGSYDGHSRFEAWLFRVARNIALDAMRKRPMFSLDSNEGDGVRSL